MHRRFTSLALALATLAPIAVAAQSLLDPEYAYRPSLQHEEIPRRIQRIVSPTIGFPALVPYGGRFTVLLRPSHDVE